MLSGKKNTPWIFYCFFVIAGCTGIGEPGDGKVPNTIKKSKVKQPEEKDVTAAVYSYTEGLFEKRLADSMRLHAGSDQLYRLAIVLSDMHSDLNAQLVGLAKEKGITLPADISVEQANEINSIGKATGNIIDRAYLDIIVARYTTTIDRFHIYADDVKDTSLKVWFKTALPALHKNIDLVKAIINRPK